MLEEIIKWSGAAAALLWLPIIINGFKRFFCPQEIIVVLDQQAILGFSPDLGSHILIRLGMYTPSYSYNEDIVFKDITLEVKTPGNVLLSFRLKKSEDTIDSKFVNEKSQESIAAVRVLPNILHLLKSGYASDKHMVFSDQSFKEKVEGEWRSFNEQEVYFADFGKPRSDLIGSKQLNALIKKVNASFLWVEGKYEFEIKGKAINKKIKFINHISSFEVSANDLALLDENKKRMDGFFAQALGGEEVKAPNRIGVSLTDTSPDENLWKPMWIMRHFIK